MTGSRTSSDTRAGRQADPAPGTPAPTSPPAREPATAPPATQHPRGRDAIGAAVRWTAAIAGALVVFAAFVAVDGGDPFSVLTNIWSTTLTQPRQLQQIAVEAAPLLLAALAVVGPARAGRVNVGGQGQLLLGAAAAAGVALAVDQSLPGGLTVALMALAAMLAGAAWAGIAAVMRVVVGVNEAVTTLLLNYVALYLVLALILGPWRDPGALGQSTSRELADPAKLPYLVGTQINVGMVLALLAAVAIWYVAGRTRAGFTLNVVGGNPEAARRAGIPVPLVLLLALLVGGALAGLAGFTLFAGSEYKLRTTFGATVGYVGFLASWLARHRPLRVVVAAAVLAAIAVSGNSLQIASNLPAATVNILMGLVLIAVLGWAGPSPRKARS